MTLAATASAIPKRRTFSVNAASHRLELGDRTLIMGIVNTTPDSFSEDGTLQHKAGARIAALSLARRLVREGADIIDIGGESTRPGARRVPVKEELERVIPAVTSITKKLDVPVSIDTYKPRVARAALDAGASIVNNIMGADPDPSLLKMIRDYGAAVVLMHMRGTPRTMQRNVRYTHCTDEIVALLQKSVEKCLEIGIKSDKIILDPGIGFGKTVEHNLELLNRIGDFEHLRYPLLVGTSRKSFIGKILDKDVRHRLMGTAASVCVSIVRGAHIVRVHDVNAIKNAVDVTDAIINEKTTP